MKQFLPWLTALIIRTLGATLRVTLDDRAHVLDQAGEREPVIVVFWHNRVALMTLFRSRYLCKRETLTFISRSRDGQFITDVAARFGVTAVRGSTSRNAVAATLAAIHAAKDPRLDIVITPDGPRGPRHHARDGVIRLAQATGRPIVAMTYELPKRWELNSWDRFHIPKPFSSCRLITQPRIHVPREISPEEKAAILARLTEALSEE